MIISVFLTNRLTLIFLLFYSFLNNLLLISFYTIEQGVSMRKILLSLLICTFALLSFQVAEAKTTSYDKYGKKIRRKHNAQRR